MADLYQLARPFLFRLDPEDAHHHTLKLMKAGLVPPVAPIKDDVLAQNLFGLKFSNPVGLAAGFDKNAEVVGPALKMGFGFVEAGTVTPRPQAGNDRPRIFRDAKHEAVINRMGFPNGGMEVFKNNIAAFLSRSPRLQGVVGINIGMNKEQTDPAKDYCLLIRMLGPMADYLTINISSPNTPGLRNLQEKEPLTELLAAVTEERRKSCGSHPPPILLKLAPDLTEDQQGEIAAVVMNAGIEGIILGNTTLARPDFLPKDFAGERGGLSGKPLKDKSTAIIRSMHRLTKGKIPIVGVGGISTGADAYEKIKAGASLVQVYSGLVFKGPTMAYSINKELASLLRADGFTSITEAVGAESRVGDKTKKHGS